MDKNIAFQNSIDVPACHATLTNRATGHVASLEEARSAGDANHTNRGRVSRGELLTKDSARARTLRPHIYKEAQQDMQAV